MKNRRNFLKSSLLGTGALALTGTQQFFAATKQNKFPTRFIFMTKSNGLRPADLVLPSLSKKDKATDKEKNPMQADLTQHELPKWMSVLEGHQKDMAIIQGLSAYRMACGHNAHQGCLGMYQVGNDRNLGRILWATADVELGRLYPSPFDHIEVQTVGANRGIVAGRAATGKMQYNYAYADPKTAYNELFKSVAETKDAQNALDADALVLDYLNKNAKENVKNLHNVELLKMTNYKQTVEQIKARDKKLESMFAQISKNIPKLDDKYFAEDATTVERQEAFVQILLGALKAGLTNSVLFSLDTLKTPYSGLPQLKRSDMVSLHDIGHGNGYDGHASVIVREWVRTHHMKLINTLTENLKKTP
jgi:hypothetical protein